MKTVRKGKHETRRSTARKGVQAADGSGKNPSPDQELPAVQRPIVEIVDELCTTFQDLGRMRTLRDPLAHLADQLSPPQAHALFWLGVDKALSAGHLADRIGCSMPTLTGIVDRLEKLGLVERARDSHDRRVVVVTLTERG